MTAEVTRVVGNVELTMHERYPEVAPFVQSMYEELVANSHKGDQAGWRLMTLRQAWQEIGWHNAKLAVAIKNNDDALIREYAADVANGCMMLVDILNHGEVDRCPGCGWVTTAENPACAWHEMRAAKGEVPDHREEAGDGLPTTSDPAPSGSPIEFLDAWRAVAQVLFSMNPQQHLTVMGRPDQAMELVNRLAERGMVLSPGSGYTPPEDKGECEHKNTHMRGWTQVCDDCGQGRTIDGTPGGEKR